MRQEKLRQEEIEKLEAAYAQTQENIKRVNNWTGFLKSLFINNYLEEQIEIEARIRKIKSEAVAI